MCKLASWIKYQEVNYYLTSADLRSKTYEEYKKYNPGYLGDICGHGAIEYFYSELKGKGEHLECTDFSTPENFPTDIAESIKLGKFRGIEINLGLLNIEGKKEYRKIQQPALEEYQKIEQSAWKEYLKIEQSAEKEYQKIKQSAWKEYLKIEQLAHLEYQKIEQPAFWDIFGKSKYRNEAWI